MFKKRKSFLFVAMLTVVTLFITACGGGNGGGGGANGGGEAQDTLTVAQGAEASTLDPHAHNEMPAALHSLQIFDTLVFMNADMEIVPGLATEWTAVDDRTYEFTLREGVTFHNGDPLTAEDVVFSLRRAAGMPQVEPILGMLDPDAIEVIDEHTVRVATAEPFAPLLRHLAHNAAGIVSQAVVEGDEFDVASHPIGTGPFRFVSWSRGDYIRYERNDDFWGTVPAFENLVIRTILEPTSRTIELETDAIDIAMGIAPVDVERVEASDDLELLRMESLQTSFIYMNNTVEHLDNVLVRQAISYAIDRQAIIDATNEGIGLPAVGPIGSSVFGFDADLPHYTFNPDRARELLAEAGYEEGELTFTLLSGNAQLNIDRATIIQSQLAEVGITIEIEPMEFTSLIASLNDNPTYQLVDLGWSAVTGDADYAFFPLFYSGNHGAAGNRSFFSNEEVDRLLIEGRTETDPARRMEIYAEVQELLFEYAPQVFMIVPEVTVGLRNYVENFVINPRGVYRFNEITFAE